MTKTTIVIYFVTIFLFYLAEGICPKNGIAGTTPGSCYFGLNFNESFRKADRFCANFYGNLASIPSAADNTKILELAREMCDEARSIWLGGTYDGQNITWSDGSPVTFNNLIPGTEAGNLIMSLDTGKWSTAAWNEMLPFVCLETTPITTTVVVPTIPEPTCPDCPVCPVTTAHPDCHRTPVPVTVPDIPTVIPTHIDPPPPTQPPPQPTVPAAPTPNPGSGDPQPETV